MRNALLGALAGGALVGAGALLSTGGVSLSPDGGMLAIDAGLTAGSISQLTLTDVDGGCSISFSTDGGTSTRIAPIKCPVKSVPICH